MEARSIKRRRLISISTNVSSQRPDLPARFESLNDDTLTTVLEFVGGKSYRSFGGLNKHCKEIYLSTKGMTKKTFLFGYAPLSVIQDRIEKSWRFNQTLYERLGKGILFYNRRDVLDWTLQQQKKFVLKEICNVAGREGRIDILEEVLNNVNDESDKRCVFGGVDTHAAYLGKLNVLKWIETKGLDVDKECCAVRAARHGQLNILKWLKEERGLELDGELYDCAALGGQLHVMKWLREQEVDWYVYTFKYAAQKGNLDILQWLHDESCPWPEGEYYNVRGIKPEVIDWLRSNGYSNRFTENEL